MARRSVLFTPGDREEMLRSAPETDADVLVFDLEDGVAPNRNDVARRTVRSVLADADVDPDAECLIRVNAMDTTTERSSGVGGSAGADESTPDEEGPTSEEESILDEDGSTREAGSAPDEATIRKDLRALAPVAAAIDGIVLPKTRSGGDVRRLAGLLRTHGLPRNVFALVETAGGVQAAPEIAAADATTAIVAGTEDLAADVGSAPSDDRRESSYARQRVVTAAAAADVDAIDTLWTDFEDEEGLRRDASGAAALGFDGKLAIHPAQVPTINEAFTPTADQRAWAREVLEARDAAGDRGVFAVDGEMIDAPLVARAEGILERAAAAGLDPAVPSEEE